MRIALIDNGSLAPAAHLALRALARVVGAHAGCAVDAVSWKHSDKIDPARLDGVRGTALASWLRDALTRGEREFVFVPLFVSAQGAIGSFLRRDLERLRAELGEFRFTFTDGLAAQGVLAHVVASHLRDTFQRVGLERPSVVVVDHGGPSAESARLRDRIAAEVRTELGTEIGPLVAASMEGEEAHNRPLFAEVLSNASTDGDLVVAPLFLLPGRHAGPAGDLVRIARDAGAARPPAAPLRCHFTPLIGAHPSVAPALADALTRTLSTFHAAA